MLQTALSLLNKVNQLFPVTEGNHCLYVDPLTDEYLCLAVKINGGFQVLWIDGAELEMDTKGIVDEFAKILKERLGNVDLWSKQ